jgi:hypothetical protein
LAIAERHQQLRYHLCFLVERNKDRIDRHLFGGEGLGNKRTYQAGVRDRSSPQSDAGQEERGEKQMHGKEGFGRKRDKTDKQGYRQRTKEKTLPRADNDTGGTVCKRLP